jgi:predicted DNA-binding protein
METKTQLSDELWQRINELAREQNREPAAILEEAVRRYFAVRRLERLAQKGEERLAPWASMKKMCQDWWKRSAAKTEFACGKYPA